MAALNRTHRLIILGIMVAVAVAGYLHYAPDEIGTSAFIAATIALAGVAWLVSFATEALGEKLGPSSTGVLQSTLGNLPEFFVVLFALADGKVLVASTSIVGSILANALLVLGLTIIAGSWSAGDGQMRFSPRLPNDTATLMLCAVFIIVLVGISSITGDRASHHIDEISVGASVCLLAVYLSWLWAYLRTPAGDADDALHAADASTHAKLPVALSATMLAVAGVGAAFVSDWFVSALDPAIETFHISEAFAGLVVVAIAGNAVENAAGVVLAWKGKSELAISVVKNSVAQIAVFLFPLLVLCSFFFDHHLTYELAPVLIGALALTAISVWQITSDGAASVFEGVSLVAMYVLLATVALYE